MDFWAQRCLEEVAEAAQNGVPPPGHASNHAMADTVMDFLFASQDASTASLVWTLCLMADHPDILQKVRAAGDAAPDRPSVGMSGNEPFAWPDSRTCGRPSSSHPWPRTSRGTHDWAPPRTTIQSQSAVVIVVRVLGDAPQGCCIRGCRCGRSRRQCGRTGVPSSLGRCCTA